MKNLLLILFFTGCATKGIVERDLSKSTRKICLSSTGKGRLVAKDHKYIFSYESALDNEHGIWQLALNFPLHKTEMFKLDWSGQDKVKFESSIEERILKENKDINPKSLEIFTSGLGYLLEEVINIRTQNKKAKRRYVWKPTSKAILANTRNKKINAEFKNLVDNQFFGLMTVEYKDSKDQSYKMDLIVRKCLENSQKLQKMTE